MCSASLCPKARIRPLRLRGAVRYSAPTPAQTLCRSIQPRQHPSLGWCHGGSTSKRGKRCCRSRQDTQGVVTPGPSFALEHAGAPAQTLCRSTQPRQHPSLGWCHGGSTSKRGKRCCRSRQDTQGVVTPGPSFALEHAGAPAQTLCRSTQPRQHPSLGWCHGGSTSKRGKRCCRSRQNTQGVVTPGPSFTLEHAGALVTRLARTGTRRGSHSG